MFQRRIDGTVNFNQDWKSYKEGFGKTEGEYWLGKCRFIHIHILCFSTWFHIKNVEIRRVLRTK